MIPKHESHWVTALVGFFFLFPSLAGAKDDTQFRTVGLGFQLEDLHYSYDGEDRPVQVLPLVVSPVYPVKISGKSDSKNNLKFYRLETRENGEIVTLPIAEVDITDAGKTPLIAFFADSKDPSQIRATALPDDLNNSPAPTFRFLNLTSTDLKLNMGHEASELKREVAFDIQLEFKGNQTETRFTTITDETVEPPQRIYSNNWAVRPDQHTTVFISTRYQPSPDGATQAAKTAKPKISVYRLNR